MAVLNRFRSGRLKRREDYTSERGGIKIQTCQSAARARAYSRSHLACPFLVHGFSDPIILRSTFWKIMKRARITTRLRSKEARKPKRMLIPFKKHSSSVSLSLVQSETRHVRSVCVVEAVSYFPPSIPPFQTPAPPSHSACNECIVCGQDYPLSPF